MSTRSQTRAAVWIMQTGRPDQLSDSMRLHRMWPAQVGFICHACVPSQERHRIISSINRWWWLIGPLLNKHGNDPLTSYTRARSSRGFISHSRLWSGHVVIFHFCLFGILDVCMCVCVCSWSLHAWLCACERTSTHLMHVSRLLKLLMLKEHYTHVIKSLQQARLAP